MAQTVGIIDLVIDNRKIDTEKSASFSEGGLINNPVVAGRKLHRSQEWKEGMVEGTTVLKAGDDPSDFYWLNDVEVQCVLDTGQTVVFTGFSVGERPKITGGEGGKVPIKMAVSEGQVLQS